jgi:hypothetical protein
MTNKINSIIALGILILVSMACNFSFSTANLSDLKFGKDKDASAPTTTFKPEDEIYAVTAVNNTSGKNKVTFRLLFDEVEGAKSGALAYKVEKELEVDGSRPLWLNFSVPGGMVPGTYKVEAVLTGEDGKQHDRKVSSFTVAGKTKASKKKASDESEEQIEAPAKDEDSDSATRKTDSTS